MNRTILIIFGIFCALLTAEVIVLDAPLNNARWQIHNSKNPVTRINATFNLYKFGGKGEILEFTRLLQDDEWGVRVLAAKALVNLDPKGSTPKFTKLLRDNNPSYRQLAVWALGQLGDKELIPEIKKLLNDKEDWVREAAEQALKQLGVSEEEIEKAKEKK